VTFPGLSTFTKAEYVLSQGISPGKCTIELPQELISGIQATGDLTISYGDESITLPNCLVDSAHIDQSLQGYIGRLTILDRRWLWKFGYISGHYNVRLPSGSNADEGFNSQARAVDGSSTKIRSGTEMAPQDIATQCLQAMGEQNFDVSALPNDARPEIDWSWTNPAEALQALCEGLGCRVTYVIDSDSVTVVAVGQGQPLPDNGLQTFISQGMNPPNTPSSLKLVGGPTIFQGFVNLEAVGIDTDGSIQPINLLSYRPTDGWQSEDPNLFPSFKDAEIRPLVEKSIYKMWRVTSPVYIPNQPGGGADLITQPDQQVHLYDRLVDTHFDPNDPGKTIPKKPEIWGNFDPVFKQTIQSPTTTPGTYKNGITVDGERSLIITEDKLYSVQGGQFFPAEIRIKIAYSARHDDDWEFSRFTQDMQLDSVVETQPQIVHRQEIFLKVVGQFDTKFNFTGYTDNRDTDKLEDEANYYLQAAAQEYIEQDSFDIPYAGLVPIQVDGLIQQVTYSIQSGPGGKTMTRASLATEHNPFVLPWQARRRIERERGDAFRKTDTGRRMHDNIVSSFLGSK